MKKYFVGAAIASLIAGFYLSQNNAEQELAKIGAVFSGTIMRSAPTAGQVENTPNINNKSNHETPSAKKMADRYKAISNNARVTTMEQRIAELNQLYPYREFSADEVLDLLAQPNAWENTAETSENLPITPSQRNDGRAFVELNPERFQVLLPGDSIDFPLEKLGMNVQAQIDSREALANGGFTLHGHVLGGDELMRVTITQGPGLSLVGIDTPQGHVVMQANDTQGWIASSETLFKQNPHKTDVLLPANE